VITLERSTIYDETLYGEPLGLPVRRPALNTDQALWTVGDWVLVLPVTVVQRAPDVRRMIGEIRGWTGWSKRQLAGVLGTSHTTIVNAEAGRPLLEARSGDLRRRVTSAHDLVRRVFLLAGRAAQTTADVLATAPAGGVSPTDALRAGNYERAYLAALDALRPRPTGMLVGGRPRRSGATSALHE
jgi:hypothetical protein